MRYECRRMSSRAERGTWRGGEPCRAARAPRPLATIGVTCLLMLHASCLLLLLLTCKPTPSVPLPGAQEPQIRATVITIQTTLQPGNRSVLHDVVINDKRARSGDEVDAWRLFDL